MNKKESKFRKPVHIMCFNHFDPIWRRGFKKPFYYKGEKYVGDYKIQEACIEDWVEMSRETKSKFEIECSLVLRTYLESHPEQLEYIKQLAQEGRFELLAAGEVIADTNMPSGETLVRNLMYGILWGEETLGVAITTGCLNDAFGSSAQLPQIFKGCGVNWITGFSYKYPVGDYWKGLDGSVIKIQPNLMDPRLGFSKFLGYGTYYRPCSICKGEGCSACNNRGFDQSYRMEGELNPEGIDFVKNPFGLIYVGGEETMAPMDLPYKVDQMNAKQEEYEYTFGLQKELAEKYFKTDIENAENCDQRRISPDIEGNPVQTGCYVSRIKAKQNVRRLENSAAAIEKLAVVSYLNGGIYPYQQLTDTWKNIAFASFHDSITGTHIDVGYEELMETYQKCDIYLEEALEITRTNLISEDEEFITVFNPHGFEVTNYVKFQTRKYGEVVFKADKIPAFGFKTFKVTEIFIEDRADAAVFGLNKYIENEFYKLTTDEHGVISIFDKQLNKELIHKHKGYANELILENDIGDPWSTREANRTRVRLGHMNSLTGIKRHKGYSEITYSGKFKGNEKVLDDPADYRVLVLEWEQKVILWDGIKRIDFITDIDWDCFDRRIRVSFPTYMLDDDGYYAIPYGTLKRKKYDRADMPGISNPDGNWPSVEWFSTAKNIDVNIGLLNKGTPCSRIENGEMLISVLRSPSFPSCLLWPKVYNAPVYDGMRDQGRHSFEYSLTSFNDKWSDSDVVKEAYKYNCNLLSFSGKLKGLKSGLSLKAEGTEIAAVKRAESGDGIVLRLNEYRGSEEIIELILPQDIESVYETNLLEKDLSELILEEGKVKIHMMPFKLVTLRLKLKK